MKTKNQKLTYIPNMIEPLKSLFESRGFIATRASRFEDYNLYIENRDFLSKDNFITFMNGSKLMALKHDVTLSIVKNIPNHELETSEKLYYMDEVYRLSQKTNEYKVISQLGIELIGPADPFSNIEVIDLSLQTMAAIGPNFVLDISHIGFIYGVLEDLQLSKKSIDSILSALHSKSTHIIEEILKNEKIYEPTIENILKLSNLRKPLSEAVYELSVFCTTEKIKQAYFELEIIAKALSNNNMSNRIFLDFSTISNMAYYDNIVLAGYYQGVSKRILAGGRYDNLLKKMNKQSGAIGFAIDLSELNLYNSPNNKDFDAVIYYSPDCDFSALLNSRADLLNKYNTVRLEKDTQLKNFSRQDSYHFRKDSTHAEKIIGAIKLEDVLWST